MHIYKKVLPVAVAMALAACGGGSDSFEDQTVGGTPAGTFPKFNPVTSDLPLNTDLLFADAATSDGTANAGVASNPVEAGTNALDGFSPTAPFDIAFSASIDPESICTPIMAMSKDMCAPNVFLVPLDTGENDALDPNNVVGVQDVPTLYSTTVISRNGGENNVLRVTPQEPLMAATKYLVFVTNGVLDVNGDPIKPSSSYNLLGENEPALSESLESVRAAVQGWEFIASQVLSEVFGGEVPIDAVTDSIAISYTFTTSDPVTPMLAMASPVVALAGVMAEMTGQSPENTLASAKGVLDTVGSSKPVPREVGMVTMLPATPQSMEPIDLGVDLSTFSPQLTSGAKLFTGYIKLPYYLTTPETTASASYTMDSWEPDQNLGALLSSSLPEGAPSLPPADVDGSYNVTYRYPFAQQQSIESVPLQLTLPDPSECSSPYKTAIYVHGITSDRTSVLALANTLADSSCTATVAIDLPLHGVSNNTESPFYALNVENMAAQGLGTLFGQLYGADAPAERHFNDPAGSGGQFINLGVLANTRDNLRQGVMDLLNLNASLVSINDQLEMRGVALDESNVSIVGVSLGGIVANTFTAVNQLSYGLDNQFAGAGEGYASELNPVSTLTASVAGTQLAYLLSTSDTFAPVVEAGLAEAGVEPGTDSYDKFLYVAQSMVDSGDPVSYAPILGGQTEMSALLRQFDLLVPTLLQQVNGDTVVPNGAEEFPLSGTAGLATLLGAQQLYPAAQPQVPEAAAGIVKMVNGAHSSLLSPDASATVTAEMQTQVATFLTDPQSPFIVVGGASAADVEMPVP